MIPHVCQIKHDPANGQYGDCLQASIASILNIGNMNDVPHFFHDGCNGETGNQRLRDWLKTQNLIPYTTHYSGMLSLEEVLDNMSSNNPDVQYLLFGNNGEDHVVICRGNKIIHDTAWVKTSLKFPASVGVWSILVFLPAVLGEK